VIKLSDRNMIGRMCAALLLWATTAVALPAQTFTTLHDFSGTGTEGAIPTAGLVQGADGNFYGTTYLHGVHHLGTVYKISPSGTLTTLHSFNGMDGANPRAGLVLGTDGNFYGATFFGGIAPHPCDRKKGLGCGTVFKITPSGALTTLYSFCSQSNCTDGAEPYSGLIQGTDGAFYGTTPFGGAIACPEGCGTIFKITPSGTLTTLYTFCPNGIGYCDDGYFPYAGLTQSTDGNFYGTTADGGRHDFGTVFKITPGGMLTRLHSFCTQGDSCDDGYYPNAALVQGNDGNFYGTTEFGGATQLGNLFKVTPTGTLTVLYTFCPQGLYHCADGAAPIAPLIKGTDGNFYGSAASYGANDGDFGTVFQITPSGTLTTLHSFGGTDGAGPLGALIQATNGEFYGTTSEGAASNCGSYGCGTVFSLSLGLGPFVETQPTFGNVGATVSILGTDLNGATEVTFHGVAAEFTVVSSSLISMTVPTRATTGAVKVVTPSGTLSSNVPFQVVP